MFDILLILSMLNDACDIRPNTLDTPTLETY